MSASSKKKLRKEQNAANLTQKQQQAQSEAKSLKRYTLIFAVSMLLIVALVIGIVLYNPIDRALDNSNVTLTVGGVELNTTMLSYFYVDEINAYYNDLYNEYQDYVALFAALSGLDLNRPLDEMEYPDKENTTWADYFIDCAIQKAHRLYSLYLKATEVGHKLTDEEAKAIDTTMVNLDYYARYYYGYSTLESYLRASYGNSATSATYKEYQNILAVAESYYNKYYNDLDYKTEDYREFEKDRENDFNAYTFSSYIIYVSNYLDSKEGTKDETTGNITYTDAQMEAAKKAAKETAEKLVNATYKDREAFDKALAALDFNKDKKDVASTQSKQLGGSNITNEELAKWLTEERKEGDMTMIPVKATDANGKEDISYYYVIRFESMDKNLQQMVNIRHILLDIKTVTDDDGNKSFDETDKAKVLADAQKILEDFRNGKDTSAKAFGDLALLKSVDGTKTTGGVVEDIYPGMLKSGLKDFEDWCFEEGRKVGDTDIVLSEHGYHIIYFESFDEMNYRDYMIDGTMRTEKAEEWAYKLLESYKCVRGDLSRLDTDRTMVQY